MASSLCWLAQLMFGFLFRLKGYVDNMAAVGVLLI
jgi:hypothetical protein